MYSMEKVPRREKQNPVEKTQQMVAAVLENLKTQWKG